MEIEKPKTSIVLILTNYLTSSIIGADSKAHEHKITHPDSLQIFLSFFFLFLSFFVSYPCLSSSPYHLSNNSKAQSIRVRSPYKARVAATAAASQVTDFCCQI